MRKFTLFSVCLNFFMVGIFLALMMTCTGSGDSTPTPEPAIHPAAMICWNHDDPRRDPIIVTETLVEPHDTYLGVWVVYDPLNINIDCLVDWTETEEKR